MDTFHTASAKTIQNLPTQCATPAGVTTMGWKSMSAVIDIQRLSFMWRILLLPITNLYKSLLIYLLYRIYFTKSLNTGPTACMVKACVKYDLINIVLMSIETGQYMPKKQWKKLVTYTITRYDEMRQQITCKLYKSLHRLHWDRGISSWWKVVHNDPGVHKKCSVIVRLLVSPGKSEETVCNKCNSYQQRDYEHILFECTYLEHERSKLWINFIESCPRNMACDINLLNNTDKTNFLLNCMNNTYEREWHDIYKSLIDFVYWIWAVKAM